MNFSAAIFDLDGTLIDSNSVWKKIDIILLERRGIRYTEETVNRMAAMTYEDAAAAMRELGVTSTEEEIVRECGELAVNEYRHNIFLKEYAAEYLTYLKGQGIKIALATASPRELYEPVLRNNHVY
ncbi:MAG: HAD family phosphatase, partial [Muribaculaceae bacterium]|nr:HAD family phosphatase [Muribaculaceae bacterium]